MLGSWELGPLKGYSGVKNILIDYTKVSGNLDLINYPLLFNESSETYLKTTGNGGSIQHSSGYDIIFTDENNVQLDHEIEHYNGTSGDFIANIRIPYLRHARNTKIRIHYGNSSIGSSQENIIGVWEASYKAVLHLIESGAGVTDEFKDSTSNSNDGTGGQGGSLFDAQRQSIINGIDSAQSESNGWDAEVKAKQGVNEVVRTSDTRCTLTLEAQSAYDITADETITATIPADALVTSSSPIIAIPTFKVKKQYSVTLNSTFSVCLGDDDSWDISDNDLTAGLWNGVIFRSGIDFDTSSIPDNAVITKVSLYIHINDDYGDSNCNVSKMSATANSYYSSSDEAGFWSDVAGSEYLSNSPDFEGNGDHTVELNSTARTDLQNQLSSNWFSVGWNQVDEVTDDNGRDAEQATQDEGPDLIVEYYLAEAELSGTLADGALETEIVAGGQTLIITLTNDTWVATVGEDNAITTALINGIDSAQSEANGWDAEVKGNMDYNDVTRNSDTVVTITLGAESSYNITANEVITVTIPFTALTSGIAIEANQKFPVIATGVVSAIVNGTVKGCWENEVVSGGKTIIIDLVGDTWVSGVSVFTPTQATGVIHKAQSFDAVDDYIVISDSSSLSLTEEISMQILFDPNTTYQSSTADYYQTLIDNGMIKVFLDPSDGKMKVRLNSDSTLGFFNVEASLAAGEIKCSCVYKGELYIGGNFDNLGDANGDHVAKWNGSSWSSLGIFDDEVKAMCVWNGLLILGGKFTNGGNITNANNIVSYNGSTFALVGSASDINDEVFALATYKNLLYAGGKFISAGGDGNADSIAKFNGTSWSALSTPVPEGDVESLIVFRNYLYFGCKLGSGDYMRRWDGTSYSNVGTGTFPDKSECTALGIYKGNLYVGGKWGGGGAGTDEEYLLKWDGDSWIDTNSPFDNKPRGLVVYGDEIYIGGQFTNNLYKYNGSSFTSLGLSDNVNTLSVYKNELIASGKFANAGGDADADYIASYSSGNDLEIESTTTTWTSGTLYKIDVVLNRFSAKLYVNGVLQDEVDAAINLVNLSSDLYLGKAIGNQNAGQGEEPLDGELEEFRVSSIMRSVGWFLTEYNNQNSSSTFYTVSDI